MIQVSNLSKAYGTQVIFDDVGFMNAGERIGSWAEQPENDPAQDDNRRGKTQASQYPEQLHGRLSFPVP
jgi:hypothetical protein